MIQITQVSQNDYQGLIKFFAAFDHETREPQFWNRRFKLWWDGNPAFTLDMPRGWKITNDQEIVGFLGVIPTFCQLLNQKKTVYNSTTWRVLPAFRKKSLSLLNKQIQFAKASLLINTTPNKTVVKVLQFLKFQLMPTQMSTEWVLLINHKKYLVKQIEKIINRDLSESRLFRPILGLGVFLLNLLQLLSLNRGKKPKPNRVRQVFQADSAFDDLWERTCSIYPNTNIRTAEVINWYCFQNPDYQKIVFGYYEKKRLLGFAIFGSADNQSRTLYCLDFWCESNPLKNIQAIVNYARKYAIDNSFDAIRFPYFNKRIGIYYEKPGLLKTRNNECKNYFKADPGLQSQITADNSYFVLAQGDYDI